jgi:hypothetical protein
MISTGRLFLRSALFLVLLGPLHAAPMFAQQTTQPVDDVDPAWMKRLEDRTDALVKKNGPGTDQALAAELIKMREDDQGVRKAMGDFSTMPPEKQKKLVMDMSATDATLTARLKQIVAQKGWPTISLVGLDASRAAALILIHTEDHAWQKSLLPHLQKLVDQGKIAGDDIALVVDKTLVADGKPQRFGTQFDLKDGAMVMSPVEDRTHLDALRQRYLLPPMAEYTKMLEQMYHVQARE